MTMLNDCEIHFAKLNPDRPNARFNPNNPSWELQLRTQDVAQKKQWEAEGLKVIAVVPNDDPTKLYYRCNLRRKLFKADGTKSPAPGCIDGNLQPVDPDTIGNGSIANVRIFQYNYPAGTDKDTGKPTPAGTATVLMGIQLTTHKLYTSKPRQDDFARANTNVIPEPEPDPSEPGFTAQPMSAPVAPSVPNAPAAPTGDY